MILYDLAQALGAREDKRELIVSRDGVEWRVFHAIDELRISAPIRPLPRILIGAPEPWNWDELVQGYHRIGDRKLERAAKIKSEFPLKTVRRVLASGELRARILDALNDGFRVAWSNEKLFVRAKTDQPTVELIEQMLERAQKIRASLPQLPPELAEERPKSDSVVAFVVVVALAAVGGYFTTQFMTVNRDGFWTAALVGLAAWGIARPIIRRYRTLSPAWSFLVALYFAIVAIPVMIFTNGVGCHSPVAEHRVCVQDLRWTDITHEALVDSWRGKREWVLVSHNLYDRLHKGDMILVRTSVGRLGYEFVRGAEAE